MGKSINTKNVCTTIVLLYAIGNKIRVGIYNLFFFFLVFFLL